MNAAGKFGAATGGSPADGKAPPQPPVYRRLHRAVQAVGADRSAPDRHRGELLAAVAELIDAYALGHVIDRDGTLALSDFALDAGHRANHLAIGNELRLAASDAIRTMEPRADAAASIPNAVLLATPLPRGTGAIAAIRPASEAALASSRATLELAALAVTLGSAGTDAPLTKTLSDLAAGVATTPLPDEPNAFAGRLRDILRARSVFITTPAGDVLASSPTSVPRNSAPIAEQLRNFARRCARLDHPLVERKSGDGKPGLATELNAGHVIGFGITGRRTARDAIIIVAEPGAPFAELDGNGWTVVKAIMNVNAIPVAPRRMPVFRPGARLLTGLVALGLMTAAYFIPVPDRIRAEAQLEAEGRHFVAASFSGVLREAKVKAGDVVRQGDTIALLEGEALQLARNTAASKADEAFRRRDAAVREKRITDAELARNEAEAAAAERDLLDWQLANLQLKAPVDGVVLDSPLERSAGAPVREGDTIAEIAPLEHMRVRADIPVEALQRLPHPANALLYLDGVQSEAIKLADFRNAPEVETIAGRTVLPVRATIENTGQSLRPGHRGVAVFATGRARLGEVLFRDAWIALKRWWR
ncbi:HlyD family efflux transporter periplasmic adaptor subunit [Ensifer adhaerens]|uniref:efflux RND transporter periplasmic adaptor subunit n=1 Tax=Ensifer adhaerens TaxID=106592 RepID=UPI003CFE611D